MASSKVLPPTYFFLAIIVMAALHLFFPYRVVVSPRLNLLGCIPLLVGVVLNLMADNALKFYKTTVKPFQQSKALITTGVYRICRHPMYLGMVLMLLGLGLLLGSLSPFIVVFFFALLMELRFVQAEEQMLARQFGKTWLDYKQRVRRWL